MVCYCFCTHGETQQVLLANKHTVLQRIVGGEINVEQAMKFCLIWGFFLFYLQWSKLFLLWNHMKNEVSICFCAKKVENPFGPWNKGIEIHKLETGNKHPYSFWSRRGLLRAISSSGFIWWTGEGACMKSDHWSIYLSIVYYDWQLPSSCFRPFLVLL